MLTVRIASIYCAILLFFSAFLATPAHAQSALPTPEAPHTELALTATTAELQLDIQRLDFWSVLPNGALPDNSLYLAVLAELRSRDGRTCLNRSDVSLHLGSRMFEISGPLDAVSDFYGMEFPVRFWGVCADADEAVPVFLLFDIPRSDRTAELLLGDQLYALPASLEALLGESAAPQSTATPTNTPTATPTFTPAAAGRTPDRATVIASLPTPESARSVPQFGQVRNQGVVFNLERLDFWSELPNGNTPDAELFVVLVGSLQRLEDGDGSRCVGADDIALRIGEQEYAMADKLRAANRFYDSEFPGFILGQCLSEGDAEPTFFIFDVAAGEGNGEGTVALSFYNALLTLDAPLQDLQAVALAPTASSALAAATATRTALPTGTTAPQPVPTRTPLPIPTATDTPAATLGTPALVTNIVDGDTIDVTIDGQTARVRYILMDTPERGDLLYAEASEANRQLVGGQTVYLQKDVNETDRYGRLLRYVYLADGTFVNAELVRQGYAQVATFPPDVSLEAEIRAAQAEAVAAGAGLWAVESEDQGIAVVTVAPTTTPTTVPPTTVPPTTVPPTVVPPTSTAVPTEPAPTVPAAPVANRDANLRAGPSTDYDVVGSVQNGQSLAIEARTEAGDWYQLADGSWIASFLVNNPPAVLGVAAAPSPVPTIVPTTVPTTVPTATPGAADPAPAQPDEPAVPPPTDAPVADEPRPGYVDVKIVWIHEDGVVPQVESDEYAEIANIGTASVNIGGWRLNAGDPGQDFIFPSKDLAPGEQIRVYTNEIHPEYGGFSFGSGSAIWNNGGDCGYLYDNNGIEMSARCY